MTPNPNAISTVLSQHAEEAAFQWLLRNDAVGAPHYSLPDLAHLDDLVAAHLDGLRLAGEAGWEICRQELSWQEPGELFTAAVLAYESGLAERIEAVTAAATASATAAPGLAAALGWLPVEIARPHFEVLLRAGAPRLLRLGLAAAADHRDDPGPGFEYHLRNVEPMVTPRALRLVGELGRQDLLASCQALLDADEVEIRYWAAWASIVLGDRPSTAGLVEMATLGGPRAESACTFAARAMTPERALHWQRELADEAGHLRLAALAAGACGDPQLVPWLIGIMATDELARVAGEAFTLITGVDLAYCSLERDQPEDFRAGPTEDPDDDNVDLDPDEDLPWPDPDLVAAWWETHGRALEPGRRYLLGTVLEEKNLQIVLRKGFQRQRAAAALELVLSRPGRPLFDIRARGDRQQHLLAE